MNNKNAVESYIHFLNTFLLCIYIYTSYLFVYIYIYTYFPQHPPSPSPPPVLSVFHPFFKVKDYEAMRDDVPRTSKFEAAIRRRLAQQPQVSTTDLPGDGEMWR